MKGQKRSRSATTSGFPLSSAEERITSQHQPNQLLLSGSSQTPMEHVHEISSGTNLDFAQCPVTNVTPHTATP